MARERVQLGGPLAEHWIEIDPEEIELGTWEDLQIFQASNRIGSMLDALVGMIADTSLAPRSELRSVLRKLKPAQFRALFEGVQAALAAPKS